MQKSGIAISLESDNVYTIGYGEESIGKVRLYGNSFHSQNQYIRLDLFRYESSLALPLFSLLYQTIKKPLQVMVSSDNSEQVDFLLAGGFACKRKCYEVEVTSKDYSPSNTAFPPGIAKRGEPEYAVCCRLLYDYYKGTHEAINPLTADLAAFCEDLPVGVFYAKSGNQIQHFAFVEENEIAYIGSMDADHIQPFAESVASRLFAEYESICFECDDCDIAAMALKSLFHIEPQKSYDTYIRE